MIYLVRCWFRGLLGNVEVRVEKLPPKDRWVFERYKWWVGWKGDQPPAKREINRSGALGSAFRWSAKLFALMHGAAAIEQRRWEEARAKDLEEQVKHADR